MHTVPKASPSQCAELLAAFCNVQSATREPVGETLIITNVFIIHQFTWFGLGSQAWHFTWKLNYAKAITDFQVSFQLLEKERGE